MVVGLSISVQSVPLLSKTSHGSGQRSSREDTLVSALANRLFTTAVMETNVCPSSGLIKHGGQTGGQRALSTSITEMSGKLLRKKGSEGLRV